MFFYNFLLFYVLHLAFSYFCQLLTAAACQVPNAMRYYFWAIFLTSYIYIHIIYLYIYICITASILNKCKLQMSQKWFSDSYANVSSRLYETCSLLFVWVHSTLTLHFVDSAWGCCQADILIADAVKISC